MVNYNTYGKSDYNQGFQKIDPFNPMMAANLDKCLATQDGEIKDFTIRNLQFAEPAYLKEDTSTWGNLVMEISMEPGVDLDLSLLGTALVESYDHVSCGFAMCDSVCT